MHMHVITNYVIAVTGEAVVTGETVVTGAYPRMSGHFSI